MKPTPLHWRTQQRSTGSETCKLKMVASAAATAGQAAHACSKGAGLVLHQVSRVPFRPSDSGPKACCMWPVACRVRALHQREPAIMPAASCAATAAACGLFPDTFDRPSTSQISGVRLGHLHKRYKRFLADVSWQSSEVPPAAAEAPQGTVVTVHCPNTGPMTGR